MASTTINDFYSVGISDNEIILKVTIKKAQIAKSTVRLNKQLVGEFTDSFKVILGKASDVLGKVLYINSTQADIDPDSDFTSFKLNLSGGTNEYVNERTQTISRGGFIIYTAEIALIP